MSLSTDEKIRLRKYEDDLNAGGMGVIVLCLWSVLKILVQIFLETKESVDLSDTEPWMRVVVYIVVMLFLALILSGIFLVHLYIGLNAMRAAKSKEYKKGYFIAAVILLILAIISLYSYKSRLQDTEHLDTTIASIIVDLTSIYVFALVVCSTLKIRRIKKGIGNSHTMTRP